MIRIIWSKIFYSIVYSLLFHYWIHKISPLGDTLRELNPVNNFASRSSTIHCNIIRLSRQVVQISQL